MSQAENLPEGWAKASLEECSSLITKGATPTTYGFRYRESGIPFVRVENLAAGQINMASVATFIDDRADKALRRSRLQSDDLLFSIAGTIGRTAHVREADIPANTNQAIAIIRGTGAVFLHQFLRFALESVPIQRQATAEARGGAMNNISLEDVRSLNLAIPPLPEQQRIVTKLEELLSHANAARGYISRVPAILKRFRQAVLAAACSGRLTEDWRESTAPSELVDEFVRRIRIERESGWGRGKVREPNHCDDNSPDTEIPDSWRWCSFDTFVTDALYGPRFSANAYSNDGIPTIRTTDIDNHGRIVFRDPPRLSLSASQARELCLRDGDLLVTRSGSIGKCAMYENAVGPAIPSAYLIRFRVTRDLIPPDYLLLFLMSPSGQELLQGGATSVTQSNVNAVTISRFPVPLPPRSEITVILKRARTLLALADAIEHQVSAAVSQTDKLTQSILAKAFRGELVPTEAELARREGREYEPASVLLGRIKKKRETQTSGKPESRRKSRKPELAAAKG
jgi:type I restriction enzyme S subunit